MPAEDQSETTGTFDGLKFGHRLLRKGLVTPEQLVDAIKAQRDFTQGGSKRPPRLGEILLMRGYISSSQVLEILNEQDKDVLSCEKCGKQFNPDNINDGAPCSVCGGALIRKTSSSALLATPQWLELLPPDIAAVARDPKKVFGKYVLIEEIGRGACGTVHRAWDHYLGQHVALKLIKSPDSSEGESIDPGTIQEFMREANTIVRLRHPNIVQIYEAGHVGDRYFMSMEFVDGRTLASLLHPDRDRARDGLERVEPTAFYTAPREFLAVLRDVSLAMEYAHTRPSPVVHRDLKPANILVERSGKPYVVDFGLAKEMDFSAGSTLNGIVKGTPSYMAPEQAEGRVRDIDVRTDIYALGAMLYEMIAGRPPFIGHGVHDVLNRVVNRQPDPPQDALNQLWKERGLDNVRRPPTVPPELAAMALRCLEKSPDRRYARAKDFIRGLEKYLKGEPASSILIPQVKADAPQTPPPAPSPMHSTTVASVDLPAAVKMPQLPPPVPKRIAENHEKVSHATTTKTGILKKRILRPWLAVACVVIVALAPIAAAYVEKGIADLMRPKRVDLPNGGTMLTDLTPPPPEMTGWWDGYAPEVRAMGVRAIEAILRDGAIPFSNFKTRTESLGAVELRWADAKVLLLAVGGTNREFEWRSVDPAQVVRIFRSALPASGEKNLQAMRAFAVQEGLSDEADVLRNELRAAERAGRDRQTPRDPNGH